MHAFHDLKKQAWTVEIDIPTASKISAATGLNCYAMLTAESLKRIGDELHTLVDLIWLTCEAQAAKHGLTFEQFFAADRMDAATIEAALDAILDEAADILPPQKKTNAKKLLAHYRRIGEKALTMAENQINAIDWQTIENTITQALTTSTLPPG